MIDFLAYIASFAVIATYFLMATGRTDQLPFDWANFIGAFFIGASGVMHRSWPSLILTVAFGTVGCIGIIRYYRKSHN